MLPAVIALALAAAPEVALLSSRADTAELRFQPLGAEALVDPAVRFTHAEGSDVFGALIPKTRVVVATATMQARGDLSFGGALLRLEAGKPARVLAEQVVYGSKPLVTSEGRVFVSRGTAGLQLPDQYRVDALTIDEIDPTTAARRVVYASHGYVTFLAGAFGRELIIYETTPARARLVAVQVDTLFVRELREVAPLARSFVVDAPRKRVLFTQGTPGGDGWFVDSVDLISGASTRLADGPEVTLFPTVLADGRVLVSAGEGKGHRALDGRNGLPANGPGFELLAFQQGALLVGLHTIPSDFPRVFALRDGKPVPLATPKDSRLDLAGVAP